MKKVLFSILLCITTLLFTSCSNSDNESTKQEDKQQVEIEKEIETKIDDNTNVEIAEEQEIENKITEETQADNEEGTLKAIPLKFNKSAKTDFVKLNFKSISATEELKPSKPGSYYKYLPDEENEKYIYAKGVIKNIGGEKFEFASNAYVKVIIDDKYTYDANIYAEEENGSKFSYIYAYLNPLAKETFYIIASVPDEVLENYKKATFEYGFTENFDTGFLNRDDCKYMFSISATK